METPRTTRSALRRGIVLALAAAAGPVAAAPAAFEATVETKEQIRLDFQDGSRHFVAMVRREGKASGNGPLGEASVAEYGRHDIVPGVGGDPSGYLVFTAGDGNAAYLKYQVRAVYVPGADGKPLLLDAGLWEVVGASGRFRGLRGAGALRIRALSPTERRFTLEGELVTTTP